jgi:hypothetical protein
MREIFKPEDFPWGMESRVDLRSIRASVTANEKLNALIESWPVVIEDTLDVHPSHRKWAVDDGGYNLKYYSRKAYLAFIEPIKRECFHTPRTRVRFVSSDRIGRVLGICECGQEMIADWRVK